MFERTFAVNIRPACARLDAKGSVLSPLHTWIVERIQIDGQATGMCGEFLAAVDNPIAETRGVVGLHGTLIVGIIVVDELDAPDGVSLPVEFLEDADEILCDGLVADEFSLLCVAVEVAVGQRQQTQVVPIDGASLGPRLPLHACKHGIAQCIDAEYVGALSTACYEL